VPTTVPQAKNIENESVVAQLLQAGAAEVQDRESYEQNIKDFATSSLLGMKVNPMPSHYVIDLVLPSLRSAKLAPVQ